MNPIPMIEASLAWLEKSQFVLLPENSGGGFINKAGIIPIYTPTKECLLMKPVAKHKDLEPPGWQIAKGTRMMQVGKEWVDVKDGALPEVAAVLEPLACTALREGMEEVGLKLTNIDFLYDLGVQQFHSAKTGKPKFMQLFVCEARSKDDFLPPSEIAKTTEKTSWFMLNDLPKDMRTDNTLIINHIVTTYETRRK